MSDANDDRQLDVTVTMQLAGTVQPTNEREDFIEGLLDDLVDEGEPIEIELVAEKLNEAYNRGYRDGEKEHPAVAVLSERLNEYIDKTREAEALLTRVTIERDAALAAASAFAGVCDNCGAEPLPDGTCPQCGSSTPVNGDTDR